MKVSDLKKLVFRTLPLENQLELMNNGRPIPTLNIVQMQNKCKSKEGFRRKFDGSVYTKSDWLCGCEDTNAFFCFVCLLFGGDDRWTKSGIRDLKHLREKIRKHASSVKHKNNLFSFQLVGKSNIVACVSQDSMDEICKHNETVTKNRHVLHKMIDVLKFCGNCNLPLRLNNEIDKCRNKGVFLELLNFSGQLDSVLDTHLQHATVFKDSPKTIQNELLQCMLEVCREHIVNEINDSMFVALMADDTTDLSAQTQTALVFRYELDGRILERFWGFENPENQDANDLSQYILQQLDLIIKDCPNKLIAQTYDGAAGMRGNTGSVNVKIKEQYKYAYLVYSYAHQLNKLLEQATSTISSVGIFFGNLNAISDFFSHSPDRTAALNLVCDKPISKPLQIQWNSHSRMVQTVFDNKDEILQCFKNIAMEILKQYDQETVTKAAGFVNWLENDTFLYWLTLFNEVMPQVDEFFSQLQKVETDPIKFQTAMDTFENIITDIRVCLPPVLKEEEEVPSKRPRIDDENVHVAAREVCDIIISQTKKRLEFKSHLSGASLFVRKNFKEYKRNMPLQAINTFCEAYPVIDRNNLKSELSVFYSRPEITENEEISGCLKTLKFIYSFGLDATFQEITNALRILVTIPMFSSETERCFSSFKKIKTFLRSTTGEEGLTALGMLSIEKSMVREIPNFNDKVIEKFIRDKNRRMDFYFKK